MRWQFWPSAFLVVLAACDGTNSCEQTNYHACEAAKSMIMSQLLSPSTATFQSCGAANHAGNITKLESIGTSAGRWEMRSYVDAYTRSGIKIRTKFYIKMAQRPRDTSCQQQDWSTIVFEMDESVLN